MAEPAPHGKPRIGVKAFVRFAVLIFLSMGFLALAVANWFVDRTWIVIVAYVICAGVLLLLARNVFPRRLQLQRAPPPPQGPSKRSGNPAVRASGAANGRRDDSPPR